MSVERDVAGPAVRDDELAQAVRHGATDERMALEDGDGLLNGLGGRPRGTGVLLGQKLEEPLEVRERPRGLDQRRHRFALWRVTLRPLARPSM